MSNTIEEEILRKRTPILINSLNYILIFMIIVFIIIINFNSYSEYFEGIGRVVFRKGEYYIEIKTEKGATLDVNLKALVASKEVSAVKEDEIRTQKGMKHAIIIITSGIKTTSIPKVAPIFCFVIFSI